MNAEALNYFGVVGTTGNQRVLKIPFFQREYVWSEKNWESLRDDLLSSDSDHFLGSVILKPEPCLGSAVAEWNVIDGQQRLTTLSVLLKVCVDKILYDPDTAEYTKEFYKERIKAALFVQTSSETRIKIAHSRIDRGAYEKVLTGDAKEKIVSEAIIKCGEWFEKNIGLEQANKILDLLIGDKQKQILIGIQLGEQDNEQAIFDTINTAGVRLTIADTVKNYIFQKYLSLSMSEDAVYHSYGRYWENVFSKDDDCVKYWSASRTQGRYDRTTLEVFLQCFAIVDHFFDPTKGDKLDCLVDCYKKRIDGFSNEDEIRTFVKELAECAEMYRDFFVEFRNDELLGWDDSCKRALHILRVCDTSTFDPLILKLLVENKRRGEANMASLESEMNALASYVLRHIVCNASVKNFNKECCAIVNSKEDTIVKYLDQKKNEGEIDDQKVSQGLRYIKKSYNRIAGEILLWLEVKRRNEEGDAQFKGVPASYGSDLEHIMPQTWQEYWPISKPAVVDPESGDEVEDIDNATQLRKEAVYEIGNMSLLNKGVNRRIKNREIEVKLNGDGAGLSGIEIEKVDIRYTRDVLKQIKESGYVWNEKTIRDRTKKLAREFLKIW